MTPRARRYHRQAKRRERKARARMRRFEDSLVRLGAGVPPRWFSSGYTKKFTVEIDGVKKTAYFTSVGFGPVYEA